jgi:hypothetical protein
MILACFLLMEKWYGVRGAGKKQTFKMRNTNVFMTECNWMPIRVKVKINEPPSAAASKKFDLLISS